MTREEMREKVADAIAYAWDMEGRVMDAADAAIALVLEEAAKVAEQVADGESVKCRDALNDENDEIALRHADIAGGAIKCAAAIRALKEKSDE